MMSLGLSAFRLREILNRRMVASRQGGTPWNLLMAASTLVVSPIIILFFFTQRTFIQGITMSGLKG